MLRYTAYSCIDNPVRPRFKSILNDIFHKNNYTLFNMYVINAKQAMLSKSVLENEQKYTA